MAFMFSFMAFTVQPLAGQQTPAPQRRAPTAIVLDLAGDGLAFSSVADGVEFAIDTPGQLERTAWTKQGSDDGFLVLDLNGNGAIDDVGEFVGTRLVLENNGPVGWGVNALQWSLQGYPLGPDSKPVGGVPRPAPSGIGVIDPSDAAFARLRLWTDRNHDGRTGAGELRTLAEGGVAQIPLTFRTYGSIDAAPKDDAGNRRVILGSFKVYKQGVMVSQELVEVALAK